MGLNLGINKSFELVHVLRWVASWIAPPNFFHRDRIIAIYLGADPSVTTALTALRGPRFAGFEQ